MPRDGHLVLVPFIISISGVLTNYGVFADHFFL